MSAWKWYFCYGRETKSRVVSTVWHNSVVLMEFKVWKCRFHWIYQVNMEEELSINGKYKEEQVRKQKCDELYVWNMGNWVVKPCPHVSPQTIHITILQHGGCCVVIGSSSGLGAYWWCLEHSLETLDLSPPPSVCLDWSYLKRFTEGCAGKGCNV